MERTAAAALTAGLTAFVGCQGLLGIEDWTPRDNAGSPDGGGIAGASEGNEGGVRATGGGFGSGGASGGGGSGGSSSGAAGSGGIMAGSGGIMAGSGGIMTGSGGTGGDCDGEQLPSSSQHVNVLIVLDSSGSMASVPAGSATSKWDTIREALAAAFDATARSTMHYGLALFPYASGATATGCEMPSTAEPIWPISQGVGGASATGGAEILGAIEAIVPGGGTPAAEALRQALEYLTTAGAILDGPEFVFFITDGGPNCNSNHAPCSASECTANIDGYCPQVVPNCCDGNVELCLDDAESISAITALHSAGFRTFVVGLPGTEAYETTLNAMADAGGQALSGPTKYYSVSATGDSAALENIATSLLTTCTQQLEVEPPSTNLLSVFLDGTELILGAADGWSYDQSTRTVHIVGAPCDQLKASGADSLQIMFGCPPKTQ
jgi:hypothetical protein